MGQIILFTVYAIIFLLHIPSKKKNCVSSLLNTVEFYICRIFSGRTTSPQNYYEDKNLEYKILLATKMLCICAVFCLCEARNFEVGTLKPSKGYQKNVNWREKWLCTSSISIYNEYWGVVKQQRWRLNIFHSGQTILSRQPTNFRSDLSSMELHVSIFVSIEFILLHRWPSEAESETFLSLAHSLGCDVIQKQEVPYYFKISFVKQFCVPKHEFYCSKHHKVIGKKQYFNVSILFCRRKE